VRLLSFGHNDTLYITPYSYTNSTKSESHHQKDVSQLPSVRNTTRYPFSLPTQC
jgi:hypothetical protein